MHTFDARSDGVNNRDQVQTELSVAHTYVGLCADVAFLAPGKGIRSTQGKKLNACERKRGMEGVYKAQAVPDSDSTNCEH